ncbi:unnamed protein product [Dicrocoelium dendriticum]|nr:unnamed protein product [Dicrocoelium dendriticum]
MGHIRTNGHPSFFTAIRSYQNTMDPLLNTFETTYTYPFSPRNLCFEPHSPLAGSISKMLSLKCCSDCWKSFSG